MELLDILSLSLRARAKGRRRPLSPYSRKHLRYEVSQLILGSMPNYLVTFGCGVEAALALALALGSQFFDSEAIQGVRVQLRSQHGLATAVCK
jgi:hypothetical protein